MKSINGPSIIIVFRTSNGSEWEEMHDSKLIELFKRMPEVSEIYYKDTGKVIYTKENMQ